MKATSTGEPLKPIRSGWPVHAPRAAQSGRRRERRVRLLQSLGTCGHCGRRLKTHIAGATPPPDITAPERLSSSAGKLLPHCWRVQIDQAVPRTFLAALEPAKLAATLAAAERARG